ncbi:MAG: hypothetical protein E7331_10470 [Clostridiales bacterium]|nr:hypothetical protein [Clostridiales bacterium]
MKRENQWLDLKKAFREEPAFCHEALMDAARSVKEDEPVKKFSYRTMIIAALIIVAMMTVAMAAGAMLGWKDYFGAGYEATVPGAGQRIMSEEVNQHEFTLGSIRFTTQELICDGHVAMVSTRIACVDGSKVLLCAEPSDSIGATGENGRQIATRLGVDPAVTWVDAAKQLDLKLYSVRAILEPPQEYDEGVGMEDFMWNEDGSLVYFNMHFLAGNPTGEKLNTQLYLRVAEIDANTGDEKEVLSNREELSIYLEAPIEEHTYINQGDFLASGFYLKEVKAELTPLGLYLYTTFTAGEGKTADDAWALSGIRWLEKDEETEFPEGICLSGTSVNVEQFPTVVCTNMLSLDAIPETMVIEVPDTPFVSEETINPGYQRLIFNK